MLTSPIFVALAVFVGVAALVGGAAVLFRGGGSSRVEDRLSALANPASAAASQENQLRSGSLLSASLSGPNVLEALVNRFANVSLLFEQADVNLDCTRLLLISGGLAAAGTVGGIVLRLHPAFLPLIAAMLAMLPVVWLLFRRKRRLKAFGAQLPEAMEMLARALRSGQSIAFGFNMVGNEMGEPIAKEFGRVFDEQNLGVPLEESLNDMTDRVPNLDLKFFSTAVILQRQTGGDLAEILDKIGSLIRERFAIWGQIQALTGEGRLSGVVLLALPLVLFLAVYRLNPEYIMVLFTDPMGQKMLAATLVLQLLGALMIRKIVNIKV